MKNSKFSKLFLLVSLSYLSRLVDNAEQLIGLNGTYSGWQVYPSGSYHYGPSILINDDESIDMWTCSVGTGPSCWDVIRYHRSYDAGKTWSPDEIALAPTPGTLDSFSACDPGVVKIFEYYYIGYTSTINVNGSQNQLFMARSLKPNGDFEKWNGSHWNSTNPQPVVQYHGDPLYYGIGEPTIVFRDNLIYLYYTNTDATGSHTDLAIGICDRNDCDTWPLSLQFKGHVIQRQADRNEDSTDIKWCPTLNRFLGVTTFDRFSAEATVRVYQSTDSSGLSFVTTPYIGARIQQGAHNIGLSGSSSGWISFESQKNFVAYAYQPEGSGWGNWPTYLTPVDIVLLPQGSIIDGQVSSYRKWSWSGPFAWDRDITTVWSSSSNHNEFLTINLGNIYPVTSLTLVPRPPKGYGFPLRFSISISNDSQQFVKIFHQHYSTYTPTVICNFTSVVSARYFQIVPVIYGTDEQGKQVFQLAEVTVQL